jgi:Fur family peroxide stress response transcriptional regulator
MEQTPESLAERLDVFEKACRAAGLKVTHQRLEIFRELAMATDHPSAEILHRRLREKIPTLSLDTVYRTLATFVGFGLINKVETVESQARFEARDVNHHHVICSRCNRIMDFEWNSLERLSLPKELDSWGRVDNKSVVVYGVCNTCLIRQE